MPFYFRKSVSAGPFRFNFSKGGVGVSVGISGFRIGTGPRGHYVHAGRGSVYYRATIGTKTSRGNAEGMLPIAPQQPFRPSYTEPNVEMIRVSSSDVLALRDERFADLLAELNLRQNRMSMAWILAVAGLAAGALLGGPAGAAVLALLGVWAGYVFDSVRRSSVLYYELEDDAQQAYIELTEAFDAMTACSAKWHIDAGGAVRDIHAWKRNAGGPASCRQAADNFGVFAAAGN